MLTVDDCAAKRRPAAVPPSLYIRVGGKYTPAPEDVLLDHVRKWAVDRFRPGALVLDHSLIIEAFLLSKLAACEHEVFAVILLDSERRLIEYVETSQGSLNGVNVCSREIVKVVLRHNATNVIFAHNHPSGRTEPFTGRHRHHTAFAGRTRLRRYPRDRPHHRRHDGHVVREAWAAGSLTVVVHGGCDGCPGKRSACWRSLASKRSPWLHSLVTARSCISPETYTDPFRR